MVGREDFPSTIKVKTILEVVSNDEAIWLSCLDKYSIDRSRKKKDEKPISPLSCKSYDLQ